MPATMINMSKYFHDSVEEARSDTLSTSFGGSDNEVGTSGEDDSPPRSPSGGSPILFAPPPGLSLPSHKTKVQRALRPPPGLNLDHDLSIQEVGPPPGLSLFPVKGPPGLEAFSAPPGIFLPHGQLPKRQPARNTRGRKRAGAVACPPQPVSIEIECPKPLPPVLPPPSVPVAPQEFEQARYRKELSDVLRALASGSNVAASVRRIRTQNVPVERQAQEFCDILTRAAEENRGVVRRLSFAFAAGLGAGQPSAFKREECLGGIQLFFEDVFEDLAAEVPRLRNKLANELVPTLRTVFSEEDLGRLVPPDCRPVQC